MKEKPRNPSYPLLGRRQWYSIWIYAAIISFCTLGAVFTSHYFIHTGTQFDPKSCNNILFFTLIICQLLHVFNIASAKTTFFKSEVFMNKNIWYALLICVIIIFISFNISSVRVALNIHTLEWKDWLTVFISALLSLSIIQVLKRTKILRDE